MFPPASSPASPPIIGSPVAGLTMGESPCSKEDALWVVQGDFLGESIALRMMLGTKTPSAVIAATMEATESTDSLSGASQTITP